MKPTTIREWGEREGLAHSADADMAAYQAELRELGAHAAANAIAKARKSVQGAERHARRKVNDLRREQLRKEFGGGVMPE